MMRRATLIVLAAWISLSGLVLAASASAAAAQAKPEDELPDGPGRQILLASCTSCHELKEVTKFKGYYTRAQWRDVVQTMEDYGAKLQPGEADVLTDYLTEHLGKR
jgi:competence protein ComEA